MPQDTASPLGNGPGARILTGLVAVAISAPLFAGFLSTETYLPAVGRVPGQNGAQFYTTVWATNLTTVTETFTFRFLKQGQANASPASFTDTLSPGQTKVYENVVETKLGLSNSLGAARITSTGEILISERIYNQAPGADVGDTEGLFFAGVPKAFSISLGQSASIQGVDQGGSENFRYNFALVETGGGSPTVNVQLFDGNATLLGQKAYVLQPYEQIQPGVADIFPGIATTNARITATVTAGSGSVLLAGAQLANVSQDSSGFEMSFRDDILGGGGNCTLCVTSLNGLTGAVTLKGGANVTIGASGSTITVSSSGGAGGGGLSFVTHDATLAGDGSSAAPLGLATPLVVSTANNNTIVSVTNTGAGAGIVGGSSNSSGIYGASGGAAAGGVTGYNSGNGYGVWGTSANGIGVYGQGTSHSGVRGDGVTGDGVFGQTGDASHAGVSGRNTGTGYGVYGQSDGDAGHFKGTGIGSGVYAESKSAYAVLGDSKGGFAGIAGFGESGASGVYGQTSVFGTAGVFGAGSNGAYGLDGQSDTGWAVFAKSGGDAGHFVGHVTITNGLSVSGTKNFVEPHPTDPTKEIRFTSLEGPESGTYFRGTAHIVGGFARIMVPEAFRLVTGEEGLTVLLTPVGSPAALTVAKESLDEIVIQGSSDVAFHYMVNGVRRGFENAPVIVENTHFVPRSRADLDFARFAPEEIVRRLKANGILNADGSINEDTASRLGWDLQPEWNRVERQAPSPPGR